MTFGPFIRMSRMQLGLSQKEVAAQILMDNGRRLSPQYLHDVEYGRRNPPRAHVIGQIATVLGISSDVLCLIAGILPEDIAAAVKANPEVAAVAFRKFRAALTRAND